MYKVAMVGEMEAMSGPTSMSLDISRWIWLYYHWIANFSAIETKWAPTMGTSWIDWAFSPEKLSDSFERNIYILQPIVCLQGLSHHLCLRTNGVWSTLGGFPENMSEEEPVLQQQCVEMNPWTWNPAVTWHSIPPRQKLLSNRELGWNSEGPGEVLFGGNILVAFVSHSLRFSTHRE